MLTLGEGVVDLSRVEGLFIWFEAGLRGSTGSARGSAHRLSGSRPEARGRAKVCENHLFWLCNPPLKLLNVELVTGGAA
jgi:hypothetical protein